MQSSFVWDESQQQQQTTCSCCTSMHKILCWHAIGLKQLCCSHCHWENVDHCDHSWCEVVQGML